MRFEWDAAKAVANRAKHGVSFNLAERVWDDPGHMIYPDRIEGGEERWHAMGIVDGIHILVVVHSHPDSEDDERIRIISARKAIPRERRRYEQEALYP